MIETETATGRSLARLVPLRFSRPRGNWHGIECEESKSLDFHLPALLAAAIELKMPLPKMLTSFVFVAV